MARLTPAQSKVVRMVAAGGGTTPVLALVNAFQNTIHSSVATLVRKGILIRHMDDQCRVSYSVNPDATYTLSPADPPPPGGRATGLAPTTQ